MSSTAWHFEPVEHELKCVSQLTGFDFQLFCKIVHVLRLGIHLHNLRCGEDVTTIDIESLPAATCQRFIKKALKTWTDSDKLFPLRRTAPSLSLISELIPLDNVSAITVFKICVQRAFGVGSEDAIKSLEKASPSSIQSSVTPVKPDFKDIITVIQDQGKGIQKITRPVYGQLQIARASVPEMLEKFWIFAGKVFKEEGETRSFEEVYNLLCNSAIPTVPKHGLLAWLIASDLAEWNVCAPPKIETLATHIGVSQDQISSSKRTGPSGPNKALKLVEGIYKETVTGNGAAYHEPDLGGGLIKVWRLIEHPSAFVPWLDELMEECGKAQGRPISVVDMEHLLCKIARYAGNFG